MDHPSRGRWLALAAAVSLLAASQAGAAGTDDFLQQALGKELKLTPSALFALLAAVLPVGIFGVWLAARLVGEDDEDLGGRAFIAGFFHRLMFTVAFWCIVLMGLYEKVPIPDAVLIFLTSLTVASIAIRFSLPNARVLLIALVFSVLDPILMAIVTVGSLVLFA